MLDIKIKQKRGIQSPGEVIDAYILKGLNIGVRQLAHAINVPPNRLYQIIKNKREITLDTAIRLGYYLDMDPSFWLDLQTQYQLSQFKSEAEAIKSQIRPLH